MAITLKQLETFAMVADLGSFRRAADRLNTTQPNVSTRISSLEALLGHALMERDAGSVRLTAKGRALLPHVRNVLDAKDTLIETANANALFAGVLRIGVTEMIAHTWLPAFLAEIKADMPNISVELTVDLSVNLSSSLFDKTIDLALQNGPFDRQISGMCDLGSYPLIWVAAPTLQIGSSSKTTQQDMAEHPILTHGRETLHGTEVTAHFSNQPKARLIPSSNLAACLHMAIQGMGITALPAIMVANDIRSKRLVQIPYTWTPVPLTFSARFHSEHGQRSVSNAAQIAMRVSQR
jgi:DNA-binding transcriptional LysR family regulator